MTETIKSQPAAFSLSASKVDQRNSVSAANNPLRMDRLERIPFRFQIGDWQQHLKRLKQLKFRVAIVGKKGSGKTTLLEQLQGRINQHLVQLPLDKTQHEQLLATAVEASRNGKVVLLDGIERLTFWQRRKIYSATKSGPGLIVVVHRPCKLPTWVHCRTNPELMDSMLLELDLDQTVYRSAGRDAFQQAGGNIRDALRLLYDQFADGSLPLPT
jgi:energy-coupling factor transporter ATP-binding protein EcfA2